MTPTIHTLPNNHIAVEGLPKTHISITEHGVYTSLSWRSDKIHFLKLPKGKWKVLGWCYELTEEQCADIVATGWNGHYVDYVNDERLTTSAKDSLDTLLDSIKVEGGALILKKID